MKNSLFFIILIIFVILGITVPLFLFLTNNIKDGQSMVTKINAPNNLININTNLNKLNNSNPLPTVKNLQPVKETIKSANSIILNVPYINESPNGSWKGYWKNACEEASIAMVENYYLGKQTVSIKEAMSFMSNLFNIENKIFGSNANTDAKQTAQLINDYSSYNAMIKDNPTIEDIKKELQQNRPVIVPLYGFDLHNKNIPFVPLPIGTSYHMFVIIGYDDSARDFITNDNGDTKEGPGHRYSYDLLMNAIHDYSYVTKHADGPARAILTYPKLVKTATDPRVYYLHENIKQWVVDENTFKAKGWTWDMVNVVEQKWLDTFKNGENIKI